MRRSQIITLVVLVAAGLAGAPGAADAHICPLLPKIEVGQLATVTVAVTVEGTPVPDVEVQVPPLLRLDRVDPSEGWKITQQGQTILYHGPPITPYTCQYFSIGVTALAKGVYDIGVIQRDAQGKVVARSTATGKLSNQNPYAVQRVYAGVDPPGPPTSGPSILTIAGVALVGLGVVLVGVLAFRSWRARREEADFEDRVETFKKQARDRSRGAPP